MQIQQIQKRLPLIIAIACGIWAILLLNSYLQRRETEIWQRIKQNQQQQQAQSAKQAVKMAVVLVASKDIPIQVPITPADISIKEIPADYIQPGVVTSVEEAIGQIASSPIASGEQILKTKLLPPGRIGKSLSELTPEGKRAITVPVDNISSIANLIRPGDHVDVLTLIAMPESASQPGVKAAAPRLLPLFQDVEVLAVGGEVAATDASAAKKDQAKTSSAAGSGTVTLALKPQEAVLLSFVQEHGKIKLDLRSAKETQEESVKPADWDSLFQYLSPGKTTGGVPGKQPMVEIYRGLNRDIIPVSEKEK